MIFVVIVDAIGVHCILRNKAGAKRRAPLLWKGNMRGMGREGGDDLMTNHP
jgi:hypothetical protein